MGCIPDGRELICAPEKVEGDVRHGAPPSRLPGHPYILLERLEASAVGTLLHTGLPRFSKEKWSVVLKLLQAMSDAAMTPEPGHRCRSSSKSLEVLGIRCGWWCSLAIAQAGDVCPRLWM